MRLRLAVLAACGLLALTGCVPISRSEGPAAPPAGWREILGSPLGPRTSALGLWTGREVLLIGGSDEPACPPNADCAPDPTPLSDGAAVDPGTGHWRRIADAPVPVLGGDGVVVGGTAYILTRSAGLLAYRVEQDRWQRLPIPFANAGGYRLAGAGDRLVAYAGTHEHGTAKDYWLGPSNTWQSLPAAPLGAGFDRTMVGAGRQLVLFDHELVPNPGAERPAVTRAAVYDWTTASWRRLPDSAMLSTYPWLFSDGSLINPMLGGADGGQVGNWGRTYPNGGTLDPVSARWSALPPAPPGTTGSAGVYDTTGAVYVDVTGAVLDADHGRWLTLPPPPGGDVLGRTIVAAGADLLVFGGGASDTWVWTP